MRSNDTCSPWNDASDSVQIVLIAATRSAITAIRLRGSVPWLRISSRFQPAHGAPTDGPGAAPFPQMLQAFQAAGLPIPDEIE